MLVRSCLDSIEQVCALNGIKAPQRPLLRSWMGRELTYLAAKRDWQWARRWINPVIQTRIGKREYRLPEDFPLNFLWDVDRKKYSVTLFDATNQTDLTYLAPESFYSRALDAETDALPAYYTITTEDTGIRYLVLAPPPVAVYTIRGVYKPSEFDLDEPEDVPLMPNAEVLEYAVLRRIPGLAQIYEPRFNQAVLELWVQDTQAERNRAGEAVSPFKDEQNYSLLRG